jgi:hypothetical protein
MNFRLTATGLDFYVDVALRNFAQPTGDAGAGGRWLAVAEICGDREIGLGRSAREALAASLAPLGAEASTSLLADPQLSVLGRHGH